MNENCRLLIKSNYRPPSANAILFIDKLSELMSIISGNGYDEIILCGDLNLDILKYDNNESTLILSNSLTSQSVIPIITKPSRITNQTATLIDNIFINQPNRFVSGILISDISDHRPLFILKRNMFTKKSSQHNTNVKYHLINVSTITNLRQSLFCLDLNHITGSNNCTTANESLAHAVDNTYKLCCPIKSKTLSNKDLKKPWISREIISNIKKRQHCVCTLLSK